MGRQGFAEEGEDEGKRVIECVEAKGEGCDEKEKSENCDRKRKKTEMERKTRKEGRVKRILKNVKVVLKKDEVKRKEYSVMDKKIK